MKSGFYTVKIILRKGDDSVAFIVQVTCQSAAGYVISYCSEIGYVCMYSTCVF